ncbi:uncharacterized protein LOC143057870 isoform X6 [Mytilus galloprovincialis]|uniref:uncharacterized protein LOC143057870 isoform X6 n=1 Tax=Mytilus galloprovincialis TaxID=29158 RepID=UPI003F7C3A5D
MLAIVLEKENLLIQKTRVRDRQKRKNPRVFKDRQKRKNPRVFKDRQKRKNPRVFKVIQKAMMLIVLKSRFKN